MLPRPSGIPGQYSNYPEDILRETLFQPVCKDNKNKALRGQRLPAVPLIWIQAIVCQCLGTVILYVSFDLTLNHK